METSSTSFSSEAVANNPSAPQSVPPPVALTIAGSDNSCGAGAQADLKVFSALGCYGQTAITCVVAEVPGKVQGIASVPLVCVEQQIRLSMEAFPVAAIKTGMLHSAGTIACVAEALRERLLPLVVDPVMVASSGTPLLEPDALEAYRQLLIPQATLLTPNTYELGILCHADPPTSHKRLREMAVALAAETGTAVLAKGGHLSGSVALDILVDGSAIHDYAAPFVQGVSPHGTGCTYSAAITAYLARGLSLPDSVSRAKTYISAVIQNAFSWPPFSALNHFPPSLPTAGPSQPAHHHTNGSTSRNAPL